CAARSGLRGSRRARDAPRGAVARARAGAADRRPVRAFRREPARGAVDDPRGEGARPARQPRGGVDRRPEARCAARAASSRAAELTEGGGGGVDRPGCRDAPRAAPDPSAAGASRGRPRVRRLAPWLLGLSLLAGCASRPGDAPASAPAAPRPETNGADDASRPATLNETALAPLTPATRAAFLDDATTHLVIPLLGVPPDLDAAALEPAEVVMLTRAAPEAP